MASGQLDIRTVVDELAALTGAAVTVEVHAPGGGPAPRAILSGRVGALSMDDESDAGKSRGLVFLPIGAEGLSDPGARPGIYFDEQSLRMGRGGRAPDDRARGRDVLRPHAAVLRGAVGEAVRRGRPRSS